jgi:hypothetical protein
MSFQRGRIGIGGALKPRFQVPDDPDEDKNDGCECCATYTLLAINLPLMLSGVAFIILGIWTLSNRCNQRTLLKDPRYVLERKVVAIYELHREADFLNLHTPPIIQFSTHCSVLPGSGVIHHY